MKLQCTVNERPMDGYELFDPITNTKFSGNFLDFRHTFENGQITEIYAPTILNYFKWDDMNNAILEIFSDILRVGGRLIIGGREPYMISKKMVAREIDWKTFNQLTFDPTGRQFNFIPLPIIKAKLLANYKIDDININYDTLSYTISAERK